MRATLCTPDEPGGLSSGPQLRLMDSPYRSDCWDSSRRTGHYSCPTQARIRSKSNSDLGKQQGCPGASSGSLSCSGSAALAVSSVVGQGALGRRSTQSHDRLDGNYTEAIRAAATVLDDNRESPRLLFYTACGHAGLALLDSDDRAAQSQRARELFSRVTPLAGTLSRSPSKGPRWANNVLTVGVCAVSGRPPASTDRLRALRRTKQDIWTASSTRASLYSPHDDNTSRTLGTARSGVVDLHRDGNGDRRRRIRTTPYSSRMYPD